jgi:glutamate racemase
LESAPYKKEPKSYIRGMQKTPIGVFDSGYGGLTVLKEIVKTLPEYDYIYLGDNARAPYGTRSFDSIYEYTLQCVTELFAMGCPLVVLACNTASARALRTIQQIDLPKIAPNKRVLGIIRPTAEVVGNYSKTKKVGVLGTPGTISSQSYILEIGHIFPEVEVFQEACPMWVPLVENNELNNAGTDFFVSKHIQNLLQQSPDIDTLLLGCTHYPLLMPTIQKFAGENITILSQGEIVAKSLSDYLKRHPEMESQLTKMGTKHFFTTDTATSFDPMATLFFEQPVESQHLSV